MYYKYPTKFYFAHLEGVNCVRGTIINDDHARYPYLSLYKNTPDHGFSEMDVERFYERATIDQPIGIFEAHEFEEQKFYCSEPHINKIFDIHTKIADNNVRLITEDYRSTLKGTFYKGYADSIKLSILTQLGEEFSNLPLDQKILKLSEFCRYCKELSYFEGFAIPRVIYCIGFIQAAYFKAFAELTHLQALNEIKVEGYEVSSILRVSENKELTSTNIPNESTDPSHINASKVQHEFSTNVVAEENMKIPITFPVEELKKIWGSIIEIPKCKSLQVETIEISREDIDILLSEMFDHPLLQKQLDGFDSEIKVCHKFDPSWKVSIGGLLYATKKRIEKSGDKKRTGIFYEKFAANMFINCFSKHESNSEGKNLGRSFKALKGKLQKYDDANFPYIKETLNILTKYPI